MTSVLRLGAVDYLNARPLVCGLGPDFSVRFDLPSVCAELLNAGEIDLGLIPTISYAGLPDGRVVPGVGIVSNGPVASVAIFTRRPIARVRSLALDTSSRTSAALTRILCANVFRIEPAFVPHRPDLEAMLAVCDAALLIGDPALFAGGAAREADIIDLGAAWTSWTSLPFVWAFWAGRSGAVDGADVRRLQAARDAGVAASDAIADAYCAAHPSHRALARRYLREHIVYDLSARARAGLDRFYAEAAALGLIARAPDVAFFGT